MQESVPPVGLCGRQQILYLLSLEIYHNLKMESRLQSMPGHNCSILLWLIQQAFSLFTCIMRAGTLMQFEPEGIERAPIWQTSFSMMFDLTHHGTLDYQGLQILFILHLGWSQPKAAGVLKEMNLMKK